MYKELISYLKSTLPLFTDKFTFNIPVISVTRSTDIVVNAVDHGLSVSNEFLLSGVKTSVEITSLTRSGVVVTAVTTEEHNLTEGFNVEIESPESDYSGFQRVDSVVDFNTFTFSLPVTLIPPSSTGTLITNDRSDFNGVHTVASVIDADNFTYVLADTNLMNGTGQSMFFVKGDVQDISNNVRIYGASTLQRIIESYTQKDNLPTDLTGFFVFDGGDIDDDRKINTNAKNIDVDSSNKRLSLINDFVFYVFIPNNTNESGIESVNTAFELLSPINKVLSGYKPLNIFSGRQEILLSPSSFGIVEHDLPYTIIGYGFQVINLIENCQPVNYDGSFMGNVGDFFNPIDTTPFKRMNWSFLSETLSPEKNDVYDVEQS